MSAEPGQTPMFIETQSTPNPETLKFLPGREVFAGRAIEFTSREAAELSPLARSLFDIDGIARVFLGRDFITLTKTFDADWPELKPAALAAILDHYESGASVLSADDGGETDEDRHAEGDYDGEAGEIVTQIKELIDSRIRPAVAQDGGDVLFHAWHHESGTVYLRMRGACAGCPSSRMTLKAGIENMLRHYVPEITQVEAVA